MHRIGLVFLLGILAPGFVLADEGPIHLRWLVAHGHGNDSYRARLDEFAKRVKEKTSGKLEIEFVAYSNSSTGRHARAVDMVEGGMVEITQVHTGALAARAPSMQVLELPYLFRSTAEVRAALGGDLGGELRAELKKADASIRVFDFVVGDSFRVIYGSRKIENIEGFKGAKADLEDGLRRRFFELLHVEFQARHIGPSREEEFRTLGGKALDFTEAEISRFYLLAKAYPEILQSTKFVTDTKHAVYATAIVMNEASYVRLPAELQHLLEEELRSLARAQEAAAEEQVVTSIAWLKEKGVRFLAFNARENETLRRLASQVLEENRQKLTPVLPLVEKALSR